MGSPNIGSFQKWKRNLSTVPHPSSSAGVPRIHCSTERLHIWMNWISSQAAVKICSIVAMIICCQSWWFLIEKISAAVEAVVSPWASSTRFHESHLMAILSECELHPSTCTAIKQKTIAGVAAALVHELLRKTVLCLNCRKLLQHHPFGGSLPGALYVGQ